MVPNSQTPVGEHGASPGGENPHSTMVSLKYSRWQHIVLLSGTAWRLQREVGEGATVRAEVEEARARDD